MTKRAQGRGAVAAIGLLVLLAGLVGGVVLWIIAGREPNNTAEGFARAAPGCTTTVTFSQPGEYYVFEELSGVVTTVEGCEATTTPGQSFAFDIRPQGGEPVERITDTSVSYDLDAGEGQSVARIVIESPGDYAVSVLGSDPAVNAAIGDDPDEGVEQLREAAIAAVIVGVVVGGLLLWLSGRRSRKAATFTSPVDPGWGVTERDRQRRAEQAEWAAPVSGTGQVPVNPHQPDERRVAAMPDRTGQSGATTSTEPGPPEPPPPGAAEPSAADADGTDLTSPAGATDSSRSETATPPGGAEVERGGAPAAADAAGSQQDDAMPAGAGETEHADDAERAGAGDLERGPGAAPGDAGLAEREPDAAAADARDDRT